MIIFWGQDREKKNCRKKLEQRFTAFVTAKLKTQTLLIYFVLPSKYRFFSHTATLYSVKELEEAR